MPVSCTGSLTTGVVWETWETAADWDATERNGVVRDVDAAAAGRGPRVWARDELVGWLGLSSPDPSATKVPRRVLVDLLRRMVDGSDWDVGELVDALAREGV